MARLEKTRSKDKGGGKKKFVYRPPDPEDVKKRADRSGGRFDSPIKDGFDTWRPKVGDNCIRVLPPTWDNHSHYAFETWVHKYIGPDSSTYLCPAKMLQKNCPICKMAQECKDAGEEDDYKKLRVTTVYYCWIIDRD